MSTSKTPVQRYEEKLTTHVPGRQHCWGWTGKIDKYGTAQFSWTDADGSHMSNAARWAWEQYRGPIPPDHRLRNTCGLSSCQRLGHWELQEWNLSGSTQEKYESKIDRSGGPDACHEWTKARDKNGYGIFSYRESGKTYTKRAHRYGWTLLYGPIEDDLMILHRCDNPPCQNGSHWFIGDNQANMTDMVEKGRSTGPTPGERHHRATLTDAQIIEVRARYTGAHGEISALAREYGILPRAMNSILRGARRNKTTPP